MSLDNLGELGRLLESCLLHGLTTFKENNTSIRIDQQPDETILFFCIDNHSKGHEKCRGCHLRDKLWGDQEGYSICDLVVFYEHRRTGRRVLCFVELKDNAKDLHHAAQQVISTYESIKQSIDFSSHRYAVKAFLIAHHGTAPHEHIHDQKLLKGCFGTDNYLYHAKKDRFQDFLRGNTVISVQKRKERRNH